MMGKARSWIGVGSAKPIACTPRITSEERSKLLNDTDRKLAPVARLVIPSGVCHSERSRGISNYSLPKKRNGIRFRLQHIAPSPSQRVDCDVLLHGHTHVPRDETIGGVRFLNPGCVTRPNRGAPPSVAWLVIDDDGNLTWKLKSLR